MVEGGCGLEASEVSASGQGPFGGASGGLCAKPAPAALPGLPATQPQSAPPRGARRAATLKEAPKSGPSLRRQFSEIGARLDSVRSMTAFPPSLGCIRSCCSSDGSFNAVFAAAAVQLKAPAAAGEGAEEHKKDSTLHDDLCLVWGDVFDDSPAFGTGRNAFLMTDGPYWEDDPFDAEEAAAAADALLQDTLQVLPSLFDLETSPEASEAPSVGKTDEASSVEKSLSSIEAQSASSGEAGASPTETRDSQPPPPQQQDQRQENDDKPEELRPKEEPSGHEDEAEESGDDTQRTRRKGPLVLLVVGMAGSGKSTLVGALRERLISDGLRVYCVNLDPAVREVAFPPNVDVRDSVDYRRVMEHYRLGPNGAILTSLNLFATRFADLLALLQRRSDALDVVLVDTPGQIEVFTWSASGSLISEALAGTFPTAVAYVIDSARSAAPQTLLSNMLHACSVLYRHRLPFLAVFNKIDAQDHAQCLEWIRDYDAFQEALLRDDRYVASLCRSTALALSQFYEKIETLGVSAVTRKNFELFKGAIDKLRSEYLESYLPFYEAAKKRRAERRGDEGSLKRPVDGD